MKVLVTGATGFVGREIVAQIHIAGHQARILARNQPAAQRFAEATASEFHPGDITRADLLKGAMEGVDAVINLVGIISEIGEQTFDKVHTEGTKNLVEAAKHARVGRFIQMSALGTRPEAASRYHRSKWDAEVLVRNEAWDYTIFRPSMIYGREDHFVNLFAKIIRWSPVVPILGRKDAQFQPVAVEVVGQAFVTALNPGCALWQTLDLCGPERLTMREMIGQILSVMRKRRLTFQVPSFVARLQAWLLEKSFPRMLHRASPLNRDQLLMLDEDNVGDPKPANELLGLKQGLFREQIEYVRKP